MIEPEDIDIPDDDLDARQVEEDGADEDVVSEDLETGVDELDDESDDAEDADSEEDEDSEEDDEDSDEEEEKAQSHRKPGAERRIAKLTARNKAIKDQLKAREAELQTLRDQVAEAKGGLTYKSMADLSEAKKRLRRELDEIEDAIDNGGYERKDGSVVEVATLKKWRRQVREELEDAVPAAERRLARQEEINREQVSRVYPDLLREKSKAAAEAERLFARVPGLKTDPEAYLMVGDLLRGRQLRMRIADEKAKARKKGGKKPPEARQASAGRSARANRGGGGDPVLSEISSLLELD